MARQQPVNEWICMEILVVLHEKYFERIIIIIIARAGKPFEFPIPTEGCRTLH
jgi:hypothetical protein